MTPNRDVGRKKCTCCQKIKLDWQLIHYKGKQEIICQNCMKKWW